MNCLLLLDPRITTEGFIIILKRNYVKNKIVDLTKITVIFGPKQIFSLF